MQYSRLATWALVLMWPFSVQAKTFSNTFLSFTLPDSWTCQQEGVAWVCSNRGPSMQSEAVIVMAAKVANPQDNLATFKVFLGQPKTITTRVGTPMPSKVMYSQDRVLAGAKWIQAQHFNSEVEDFYTLYVATVKDQLAILVTFSADKSKYAAFNPVFDMAMRTLKLTASQKLVFPKNTGAGGINVFGITGESQARDDLLPPPMRRPSKTPFMFIVLGLVALMGAAAYYFYIPKNKK